jgi:hypothetical protein
MHIGIPEEQKEIGTRRRGRSNSVASDIKNVFTNTSEREKWIEERKESFFKSTQANFTTSNETPQREADFISKSGQRIQFYSDSGD